MSGPHRTVMYLVEPEAVVASLSRGRKNDCVRQEHNRRWRRSSPQDRTEGKGEVWPRVQDLERRQ